MLHKTEFESRGHVTMRSDVVFNVLAAIKGESTEDQVLEAGPRFEFKITPVSTTGGSKLTPSTRTAVSVYTNLSCVLSLIVKEQQEMLG